MTNTPKNNTEPYVSTTIYDNVNNGNYSLNNNYFTNNISSNTSFTLYNGWQYVNQPISIDLNIAKSIKIKNNEKTLELNEDDFDKYYYMNLYKDDSMVKPSYDQLITIIKLIRSDDDDETQSST